MLRKLLCAALLGSVLCQPGLSADEGRAAPRTPPRASSTKRVLWTIVGAGAGFGAGLFLGLNAFDDAIDSDRKVWTSALVGAAAGGVLGNLFSRDRGPSPQLRSITPPRASPEIRLEWRRSVDRDGLEERVRRIGRGR